LRPDYAKVISFEVVNHDLIALQRQVLSLDRRLQRSLSLLRIFILLFKLIGGSLNYLRFPDPQAKSQLLHAIDRSQDVLPIRVVLRIIRLSQSRYHGWKRQQFCSLDDRPSCPRSTPQQLTPNEISTIKEMITSEEFRHVSTGRLALLAQRLGKVFASPTTWYRLVQRHQWRRPRNRIHPDKPKVGIRASRPNEFWHVDTTVIRLLDGTRAYLRAVIDNFSRRVLAWKVLPSLDPTSTAKLLVESARGLFNEIPTVIADSGVENLNEHVDQLIDSGLLRRLLAQTEIAFSNSLIESWWRTLKHQWLYLNSLDNLATLEKLVNFYVDEHNTRLPHSAFQGQTPNEMYFGTGQHIPEELQQARKAAREARRKVNLTTTCSTCPTLTTVSGSEESVV
jgi:transposase InsO family protein